MESSDLPTEHKPLSQPPLKYVAAVLEVLLLLDVILFIFFEQQAGLRENFAEATVTVEECPDLRSVGSLIVKSCCVFGSKVTYI